jgi:hypothetical protein
MSNRKDEPDNGPLRVDVDQLHRISELTIAHYDRLAEAYWDGTRDHEIIYSADFYQHCYGARQVFTRIDHYVRDHLRILVISDSRRRESLSSLGRMRP